VRMTSADPIGSGSRLRALAPFFALSLALHLLVALSFTPPERNRLSARTVSFAFRLLPALVPETPAAQPAVKGPPRLGPAPSARATNAPPMPMTSPAQLAILAVRPGRSLAGEASPTTCKAPYRAAQFVEGMDYASALQRSPGPVRAERRFVPPYHQGESSYHAVEFLLPETTGPYTAVFLEHVLVLHGPFDAAGAQLHVEELYLSAIVSAGVLSRSEAEALAQRRLEAMWGGTLPETVRAYRRARIAALEMYERREITAEGYQALIAVLGSQSAAVLSGCAGG